MTNPDALETLARATDELISSALNLAAYADGLAKSGYGQRDTCRNMAADVQRRAESARVALKSVERTTVPSLP